MSTVHALTVTFGGYTDRMRFDVNTFNYDVFFGKKWTSKHLAIINCSTKEINLEDKRKTHAIVAGIPRHQSFLSGKAIRKCQEQNCSFYAVTLRKIRQKPTHFRINRAQGVQRIFP